MSREHFGVGFGLVSGIGALGCVGILGFGSPAMAADAKVDIGADITKMCGTKPIRIGVADGYGGNTWRKIVLAEIKDEAAKCPNIKDVIYLDAAGDPQKLTAISTALSLRTLTSFSHS